MGRNKVFVVGVGMTKFEKPGRREGWDYPDMARESGTKALADAGLDYTQIEQGFVGYVAGDSTCGQRALYELGMTGIPIVNVNNNCSTGSTALYLGAQAIRGGLADCVLALGFEKMQPGSLGGGADDRESPLRRHIKALAEIDELAFPVAPWMFAAAGREYMRSYGATAEHFAKIGYKNHKHSVNNPYAQFQTEYSLDDIINAPMISDPVTKLQCSPTSDGSAAAVLVSERFLDEHDLAGQAVQIVGQAMTTDFASTFDGSARNVIGAPLRVRLSLSKLLNGQRFRINPTTNEPTDDKYRAGVDDLPNDPNLYPLAYLPVVAEFFPHDFTEAAVFSGASFDPILVQNIVISR